MPLAHDWVKPKPKSKPFSKDWSEKAADILSDASVYHWFLEDDGQVLCDPCPGEEIPEGYDLDTILVHVANLYCDKMNEPHFGSQEWRDAGYYLGLNEFETTVFFVTSSLEKSAFEEKATGYCTRLYDGDRPWDEYWSKWLRDKIESELELQEEENS